VSVDPDADSALLARLLALSPEWRGAMLDSLGPEESDALDSAWRAWAHKGQLPPASCDDGSDWRTWVIMAGRGFGKTRAGAEWVLEAVRRSVERGAGQSLRPVGDHARSPLRIALVAATLDEARRIMVEGESGLIAVADPWIARWEPTRRILTFAGGAEAHLFSGASPEQLRGPQHHLAWCDELAKWEKPKEAWDMLQLGLRLGERPRTLVTTTPGRAAILRQIMDAPRTVVTRGPTRANPHTSEEWRASVHDLYAGTRLARQELEGELLPDYSGALWSVELLERCRLNPSPSWGEGRLAEGERGEGTSSVRAEPVEAPSFSPDQSTTLIRLVVAVDPPAGDGTCGIVACARDGEGRAHVLADHSVTARTPEGWSTAVAEAAALWGRELRKAGAARGPNPVLVVAEQNQGGRMVESVLRIADPYLCVKLVTAIQGKTDRATPVALLFEAGKVTLHGRFPELEAQLLGMIAGGGYEGPGASPDRADAMVWALTELMLTPERGEPRVRRL
jgi:phage terminase large subunit-like protein